MDKTLIAIIVLVVIMFGPNVIYAIVNPIVTKRLTNHILMNDFDGFDKDIKSLSARIFMRPFNRDYLRLNAAFLENNKAKITKEIGILETRKLNDRQKVDFYRNAFSYYMNQGNKKDSARFIEKLKECKNTDLAVEAQLIYDVQFNKKKDGIEEVIKMAESALTSQKPFYYSLIAQMYSNANDEENAQIYIQKSEEVANRLTAAPVKK